METLVTGDDQWRDFEDWGRLVETLDFGETSGVTRDWGRL